MPLTDYPIETPYGWVTGYPLNVNTDGQHPGQGFHRGIDYGFPENTPVVVNGTIIGNSGSTGFVTGPHLHIGRFVNGAATDPGVGKGLALKAPYVYQTGYDTTNGYWVQLMDSEGVLWVYLHLAKILVAKGQKLEGGDMSDSEQIAKLRGDRLKQIADMVGVPDGDNQPDIVQGILNLQQITQLRHDRLAQIASEVGVENGDDQPNIIAAVEKLKATSGSVDATVLKPGKYLAIVK